MDIGLPNSIFVHILFIRLKIFIKPKVYILYKVVQRI